MPGLDPGIHVFDRASKTSAYDVDPRVKPGDDDRRDGKAAAHTRSNIAAIPWPPPMHMVVRP
jgi:hypothetical protein